ncbi:MAG: hypothetical protein KDA91_05010 [Planctomycetaceae bacterium]|nr:hypothetical protein [Planctomycetaceae bacterium]
MLNSVCRFMPLQFVLLLMFCAGAVSMAQEKDVAEANVPSEAAAGGEEVEKTEPPPPPPIPLQPYVVRVEIGSPLFGTLSQADSLRLRDAVDEAVVRMYGSMWVRDVVVSDWLQPGQEVQLRELTNEAMHERYGSTELEKVMLVIVEPSRGGFQIGCREYDVRVQELTPTRTTFTQDWRAVADQSARLIRDSFRPVSFLSAPVSGSDELEFFLQAGQLIPPDSSAAQVVVGDVLRPFLRHMERRNPKQLRYLQKLDLTYVRVTEVNRELTATGLSADDQDVSIEGVTPDPNPHFVDHGRIKGVLISHGFAPFGGRGRGIQQIALRQRPMADSSEVQLVLRMREDRPLICHRVDKVAKLRYRDESDLPSVRLVSDREGRIRIPVDPEHPTFWLYVYSGSLLLARVPYAPGLLDHDVVMLPDDSIRLGVEGELYLFRDELVDIVAQQAVLRGSARQAAKSGDKARLEELIQQLEALPGKKEFEFKLNAIHRPAVDRANELRNRSAVRNVDRLCGAMSSSLDRFFASEKQVEQMKELDQLRRLAEQNASQAAQ